METFRIEDAAGRQYHIQVKEVTEVDTELIQTVIEIDHQTFSESTFSHYSAMAILRNGIGFLLCADEDIIGACVFMRNWQRPNECSVLSMSIRPGWRGRGLGQLFVKEIIEKLRHKACHSISLLVGERNKRAIKVYEDVGFSICDEGPRDPRSGEKYLFMRMFLRDESQVISLPGTESLESI